MTKIKKTFLIPVITAVTAGIVATAINLPSSTFAYLTDGESTTNKLTVGENVIEITEKFTPPEELVTGANTFDKEVKVTNTGDVSCFTRVFLELSDNDVRGESKLSPDGTNFYTVEEFKDHLPTGWVYEDSALLGPYYYYTSAIAPGEETPYLIKKVQTTFASAEDIEPYDIYVYAESVQVLDKDGQNFTGADVWKQAWTEYLN